MALVSTICPECKASIKLDDSKPFGFCLSCGSKIALNTLQQNNIHTPPALSDPG